MMSEEIESRYRLLIVTTIPVVREGDGYSSLDLWVRDLEAQREVVSELCVVAPLATEHRQPRKRIPADIRILTEGSVRGRLAVDEAVRGYDVIQVGAGSRRQSAIPLRFARSARSQERCLILGISSNRAQATILNAQQKTWAKRLKAHAMARSILATQRRLARIAHGVFLVGHGLTDMLGLDLPNYHVGIASWIRDGEVIDEIDYEEKAKRSAEVPALRLCVGTRLERMKGVHLAIDAMAELQDRLADGAPDLTILGRGPELQALQQQAEELRVRDRIRFGGTFPYPGPFFEEIRRHDVMLLTNLNVEQPRVIFDAISQGLVPICPDSAPYRSLEIDTRVLYRMGDASALARAVERLQDRTILVSVMKELRPLAQRYTIDAMHRRRAAWIARTLAGRERASDAGLVRGS
jgi:glycosyltransferase involved in cell wall biosynthesis